MIPFLDLKTINAPYEKEFKSKFDSFLEKGWYILGNEVTAFQKEYAAYCGTQFCIGTAKGLNKLRDTLQFEMEACLWYPKNNSSYAEKKIYINQKNTPLPFSQLKTALEKTVPNLALPTKKLFAYKILIALFSFANLPAHLAINSLVNQFDDVVFHGSIKYLGGLIIFFLWWIIGISGFTTEVNIYWGLSFFICSISSLYLRQYFVTRLL